MDAVIWSRTTVGMPFRCRNCGTIVRIRPSPGSNDAPCPVCGQMLRQFDPVAIPLGPRPVPRAIRAEFRFRTNRRMLGVAATVGRQIRRAFEGFRRRQAFKSSSAGLYDHWFDG